MTQKQYVHGGENESGLTLVFEHEEVSTEALLSNDPASLAGRMRMCRAKGLQYLLRARSSISIPSVSQDPMAPTGSF